MSATESIPAALKEWPLWEVFVRSKQGLEHKHCGSLHASDARQALAMARDVYTRRQEGVSIWVVPSANISASMGIRRSAWPFSIGSCRWAKTWSPDIKTAAQCAADVSNASTKALGGNRAHLGHFGDVVAQQVFDAHLQRQRG